MATRFVDIDRDTALLLPPDLRDWAPANHLVHFIIDAVEKLDWREVKVNTRSTGDAPYPPSMLLALLVYSYATGVFGSRRIEQSTYDHVAVRLLTADTHPDHDILCTFRREQGTVHRKLRQSAATGQGIEARPRHRCRMPAWQKRCVTGGKPPKGKPSTSYGSKPSSRCSGLSSRPWAFDSFCSGA